MAKEWVKVEGLSELQDALEELPKSTQSSVLRKVLTEAAQPMAINAASIAPRRSGRLALSIKVSTSLSKRQRSLNKKQSPVEVYVGAGPVREATMQEFGTAKNRPQPFMRPSWDGGKMPALDYIKTNLGRIITQAAERLAKKTAKFQK